MSCATLAAPQARTSFQPRPIDVSGVRLPQHLAQLVELLAEHNHNL